MRKTLPKPDDNERKNRKRENVEPIKLPVCFIPEILISYSVCHKTSFGKKEKDSLRTHAEKTGYPCTDD
jgi:hypothetical protein